MVCVFIHRATASQQVHPNSSAIGAASTASTATSSSRIRSFHKFAVQTTDEQQLQLQLQPQMKRARGEPHSFATPVLRSDWWRAVSESAPASKSPNGNNRPTHLSPGLLSPRLSQQTSRLIPNSPATSVSSPSKLDANPFQSTSAASALVSVQVLASKPSEPVLTADALQRNVERNLDELLHLTADMSSPLFAGPIQPLHISPFVAGTHLPHIDSMTPVLTDDLNLSPLCHPISFNSFIPLEGDFGCLDLPSL